LDNRYVYIVSYTRLLSIHEEILLFSLKMMPNGSDYFYKYRFI
jgi:hypothetical protein